MNLEEIYEKETGEKPMILSGRGWEYYSTGYVVWLEKLAIETIERRVNEQHRGRD